MRQLVNERGPQAALERILTALEQELIAATDEEIFAAAKDLGMNPAMRGSAAFIGIKYAARYSVADWLSGFDPALLRRLGIAPRSEGQASSATLPKGPIDE
ncbi:MAG: hypothetical protein ABSF94_05630 [Steroidobacteraceae bacterium]|jgi:hypothetical protein